MCWARRSSRASCFPAACHEGEARYHLPALASGVIVSIIGGIAVYMAVTVYHSLHVGIADGSISASPSTLCRHRRRLCVGLADGSISASPMARCRHRRWSLLSLLLLLLLLLSRYYYITIAVVVIRMIIYYYYSHYYSYYYYSYYYYYI